MIAFDLWLAFVTTVLILMSTPGPSHILMLSNSLGVGFKKSLATALGDLTANAFQIFLASLGIVSLFHSFPNFFIGIKWLGVAYLTYLGVKLFRSQSLQHLDESKPTQGLRSLFLQGLITSLVNPKAVLFFAALLPQFIDPTQPSAQQFFALGVTYILIDGCFLSFYGRTAEWISQNLNFRLERRLGQITGVFVIGAACLLALKGMGGS